MPTFQILSVCTANICRSPATETFLQHDLADETSQNIIDVNSFGTQAMPGRAACDLSTALVSSFLAPLSQDAGPNMSASTQVDLTGPGSADGPRSATAPDSRHIPGSQVGDTGPELGGAQTARSEQSANHEAHSSRRVTEDSLQPADLILALDRGHRSALARISPRSRSRTFTLRQAALLATHVRNTISAGEVPQGAPPLPAANQAGARLLWLVDEMDAARGTGANLAEGDSSEAWHPLDIPDPHVVGYQIHAAVIELIRAETREISSAIQAVLQN